MNSCFVSDRQKRARRPGALLALLACLATLVGMAAPIQAFANDDLLRLPAVKSDRVTHSVIMDVVNTGKRLVAVGERGHILVSEDHGLSWTQADVPTSVTLTAVCFPSPEKGWAVGHEGVILHSKDGGRSWTMQLNGSQINARLVAQAKQLLAAKKAELAQAADPIRQDRLELDVENIGFFVSDTELAMREGPIWPFMDVWFKNESEGFVIGAFGMILGTVDGGLHWQPLLDRIENFEGLHYYGMARCGGTLFIVGERGMLFRSVDEGVSWQRLDSPYEGSFFGIVCQDAGPTVVAFGLRGNAFFSTDRGRSWQAAATPKGASYSGAAFIADGSLLMVANDGSLVRGADVSGKFERLPIRFPGGMAMAETGDGHVVMVGLAGVKRVAVSKLIN